MRKAAPASSNLNDGYRAIGEAVIILTRSLKQFRLDKIEVCWRPSKIGLRYDVPRLVARLIAQKLSNVTILQRLTIEITWREKPTFPILQYLCHNAKVVHAFGANTPFEKLPGTQITYPRLNSARGTAGAPLPATSCLGAFRTPAAAARWIASSCRHPKTCT